MVRTTQNLTHTAQHLYLYILYARDTRARKLVQNGKEKYRVRKEQRATTVPRLCE